MTVRQIFPSGVVPQDCNFKFRIVRGFVEHLPSFPVLSNFIPSAFLLISQESAIRH